MATNGKNGKKSYIYLGLAGETGRGRVVHSGLFRMTDGSDEWEAMHRGLPEAPAVRALAVHPLNPEIVYAGTQSGPYRTADHGKHWEKVDLPDHGLPVWSILFHPHDPDVILIGYENCEIYRSDDAGEHWIRLPVSVHFPEITTAPGANPAKRVLRLDASAGEPDLLYAAIEVGGTLRSTDGGEHWENLSHGQYVNDDAVDMHAVLASRWRPGHCLRHRAGRHVSQRRRRRPLAACAIGSAQRQRADLLPRHPRGAGHSAQTVGRGRRQLPERGRRIATEF